jgi:hypothetical protein
MPTIGRPDPPPCDSGAVGRECEPRRAESGHRGDGGAAPALPLERGWWRVGSRVGVGGTVGGTPVAAPVAEEARLQAYVWAAGTALTGLELGDVGGGRHARVHRDGRDGGEGHAARGAWGQRQGESIARPALRIP